MADNDPTTPELLAAWDAYDLFDYADDSEGFAALVAIAEPMVERLRAGVSPQPEITTVDGRDHGASIDAQTVIARFFCHELAGEHAVPNDTHRDVAIDLLSELRAAGLVYDGPQPNDARRRALAAAHSSVIGAGGASPEGAGHG